MTQSMWIGLPGVQSGASVADPTRMEKWVTHLAQHEKEQKLPGIHGVHLSRIRRKWTKWIAHGGRAKQERFGAFCPRRGGGGPRRGGGGPRRGGGGPRRGGGGPRRGGEPRRKRRRDQRKSCRSRMHVLTLARSRVDHWWRDDVHRVLQQPKDARVHACGHQCLCRLLEEIDKCPVCREPVMMWMRVRSFDSRAFDKARDDGVHCVCETGLFVRR